MSIEGVGATYGTSLWEVLYGGEKNQEKSGVPSLGGQGEDTVTISAEALSKLEESKEARKESSGDSARNGQDVQAGAGAAGGSMSGGGVGESEDSEESLEAQIKSLEKELAALEESSLPEDAKTAKKGALQSQIGVLQQELAKIRLAKLKG